MLYFVGLVVLAIIATYPLSRRQKRKLHQHVVQTGTMQGDPSGAPHDASPIAAEALLRGGFGRR